MSVATEPRAAEDRPASTSPCENCGAPLLADQEWCLECGAARTLIHRAPDWRIAAAIVATVVVLVAAGFAIALINLSSQSRQEAGSVASTTTASSASTTASAARRTAVPGWPAGLPGWTVVVFSATTRHEAVAEAKRLAARGLHVGVLNTSLHPSGNMPSGRFAVFLGRYPTAQAAQARTKAKSLSGLKPRVRRVGRPGVR